MKENYFSEFKWALPISFSDALLKCLFNVGDILYDNKKAYELNWGDALLYLDNSIQVKSISSIVYEGIEVNPDSTFYENWETEITFDLISYPSMKVDKIVTTQGSLYSFLWKGDKDFIFNKFRNISKPLLIKSITKNISKYIPKILQNSKNSDYLFIYPINIANQFYFEKERKIEKAFKSYDKTISFVLKKYPPSIFDKYLADQICPTIRFNVFEINGSETIIHSALKEALYIPSKNKKSDKEYFRLKSHGTLIQR